MNRSAILVLALLAPLWAAAQELGGMASRGVKPSPRAKASGLPFHARFTDVAQQAGLREPVVFGGVDTNAYIIEAMGAGIAFLDYDNDGWLDALVLSGSRLEGVPPGTTNRLYKNNRDGTFSDVTEKAGLVREGWAYGVTIGDYNNDDFEDLFITYWGRNVLYRNNGGGAFTDVTKQAGLFEPADRWGTGCTWIDYDRDGRLDLFVSNYLVFDPKLIPPAGRNPNCNFKGILINCGPRGLAPETFILYRNKGDGTFENVTEKSGVGGIRSSFALTAVAADFDGDSWQDIFVAGDSTPSLLFRNNHDGTFTDEGLERGVALNEDGQEQAGMGVALGDFDIDGQLDIFKTHFTEDTPGLFRNSGNGNFRDVTIRAGLGVETRYVSWGAGIEDLDNDGLPDIFWVTGSVYPEVGKKHPEFPHRTPRVLFRNLGNGKFEQMFEEPGPGVQASHASRGVAFGDYDNDGDLDILVMNQNEPPSLLKNDLGGKNHWLKVRLIGTKSNRSAIGARVTVSYGAKKQSKVVLGQSAYLSVSDRRLHFGLGKETSANIEIQWPGGAIEKLSGVATDQLLVIKERP